MTYYLWLMTTPESIIDAIGSRHTLAMITYTSTLHFMLLSYTLPCQLLNTFLILYSWLLSDWTVQELQQLFTPEETPRGHLYKGL